MNHASGTTGQPSLPRQLRKALRVVAGSNISRMAAALSYRTVFGLIPMLAIGVAVLGAFASNDQVKTSITAVLEFSGLQEIMSDSTALPGGDLTDSQDGAPDPGDDQADSAGSEGEGADQTTQLEMWLNERVTKWREVSFVAIGLTGLLILAYAALSFMVEIERSANHIYRAPTGRSWVRRITQYWTTLTLGSIFLIGTFYAGRQLTETLEGWSGNTSFGANAAGVGVSLLIDFFLLFFIYTTVPNARVNMRCAAIGSALAAILWEAGKWGFQIFIANSSTETIYGAIALVPLFLLWVYITWIIVLSGLQISYVLQHFQTFAVDDERRGPALVDPLTLVRVAVEVARKFTTGDKAAVADIAKAVGLDEHTSLTMLERLSDAKVLNRVPEGQEREVFALARPAGEIAATELLELAGRMAEVGHAEAESPRLTQLRRAQLDAARGTSLADLMGGRPTEPAPPPTPTNTDPD